MAALGVLLWRAAGASTPGVYGDGLTRGGLQGTW
jgi:hypothetical protein